jgi:SEL1 protein
LFSAAAGADLAEAHIQLGKMHASESSSASPYSADPFPGETDPKKQGQAVQAWSQALALGNNFEAFYHLGRMHAQEARTQGTGSKKKSGTCGVAVAYFKTVAERGSWQYPFMRDAERAWARGERAKALISWWIAGEMGYETAQNNVAFILDQGEPRRSAYGSGLIISQSGTIADGNPCFLAATGSTSRRMHR